MHPKMRKHKNIGEESRASSPDNSRVEVAGYARQRVFGYTKVCGMPDNAAEPVTSTRFM
jgi:hypothetical protein